jgi:hypothetical protein
VDRLERPAPHRRRAVAGDGVGGTGLSGDTDGVGGTGITDPGDGVGGTGIERDARGGDGVGGTGVVGVVTGFGSICVNGLELEYDASTPVEVDGAAGTTADLAVGQLVVVNASRVGSQLRADRIAVRNAAVGPAQSIDTVRGELHVLGQRIAVGAHTIVRDGASGRTLSVGDPRPGSSR